MVDRHSPDKVVSPECALAGIPPNALVAVGGVLHDNKPVALERRLLAAGCRGIRYIGLSGSGYDLDLLVALREIVRETFVPVVTFEELGFAPAFRWAVESREIVAHIVDVASVMAGYFAGASGVPFHPVTAIRCSDVTRHNPLISEVQHGSGGIVPVVAAITPDIGTDPCPGGGSARQCAGLRRNRRSRAAARPRRKASRPELRPPGAAKPVRTRSAGHHDTRYVCGRGVPFALRGASDGEPDALRTRHRSYRGILECRRGGAAGDEQAAGRRIPEQIRPRLSDARRLSRYDRRKQNGASYLWSARCRTVNAPITN